MSEALPAMVEDPRSAPVLDWLVWSKSHGAWWRPECKGYTESLVEAGYFPLSQVQGMFSSTWPHGDDKDTPIHVSAALERLNRERRILEDHLAALAEVEVVARQPMRLTPEAHRDFLNLSTRAANVLAGEGCHTIQDAANLSEAELLRLPRVGVGVIREIKAALSALGLGLKP